LKLDLNYSKGNAGESVIMLFTKWIQLFRIFQNGFNENNIRIFFDFLSNAALILLTIING